MLKPQPRGVKLWQRNGDHPLDYDRAIVLETPERGEFAPVTTVHPDHQREHDWEGQLVRRYRNPFAESAWCDTCHREWNEHGWVDHVEHKGNSIEIDYTVCPGTPIEYIDRYIDAVLEARG